MFTLVCLILASQVFPAQAFTDSYKAQLQDFARVKIDKHLKYRVGYNEYSATYSGTGCRIYMKHNGIVRNVKGVSDSQPEFRFDLDDPDNIDTSKDLWIWTSCGDGLIIDRISFNWKKNGYAQEKWWGQDNGGAWCLSTEREDGADWNKEATVDIILNNKCYETIQFKPNGRSTGWLNYTPSRRSLGKVPTTDDVIACEKDAWTPQSVCDDLVSQILDDEERHPENSEEIEQSTKGPNVPGTKYAMAYQPEGSATGAPTIDILLYVFAAVGVAFLCYGAFQHFFKKEGDYTEVQVENTL